MSDTSPAAETATAIVIGEALVRIEESGGGECVRSVGGWGLGTAAAMARLGGETRLLTCVGRDADSALLVRALRRAGVTLDPGSHRDAATGFVRCRADPEGTLYEWNLPWILPAPAGRWQPTLVMIGSLGCYLSPGDLALRKIARRYARTATVIYDPCVQPVFMRRDHAIASVDAFAALSHVVMLREADAGWLWPMLNSEQAANRLLSAGAALAVIDGHAGITASTGERTVWVEADPRTAPEPSKDSLPAALAHAIGTRGLPPRAAVGGLDEIELRDLIASAAHLRHGRRHATTSAR